MANIKKAFQPIVDLLEANSGQKVSKVLDEVIALASAKTGGGSGPKSYHMLSDGTVAAVKCAYHKKFMDPRVVEFGSKKSSPTGLASMSKDGTAKWNAQYKEAKEQEANILTQLQAGEISVEDIPKVQEEIAAKRSEIVPLEDGYGFDTLEECLADSEARGLAVE